MTNLKINLTQNSRLPSIDFQNLPFGKEVSDHMFVADYKDGKWVDYRIQPVERLSLHPMNLALHYGQSIFEGMKASITEDGVPLLFRPSLHGERLNASARRMCMPEFPVEDFVEILHKLIAIDKNWIPPITGSTMYIRPFMFATDESLGVKSSETYKFVILTLPVGPYYNRPVKLLADMKYVRAANGGVGEAKTAGNYAAALYPSQMAKKQGYDQVLWLDAVEHKYIQEVGTMNIFFSFEGKKIVTPATTGTILKGITRKTAIELLTEKGYEIEERLISIDEVVESHENGSLLEVFGTGTAALIANVAEVKYGEKILQFDEGNWDASLYVKEQMNGFRNGSIKDRHGWVVPVKDTVMV